MSQVQISEVVETLRGWKSAGLAYTGAEMVALADRIEAHGIAPPDGWVLVPVEPTEEMIASALRNDPLACDVVCANDVYIPVYKAMLAAAPKPEDV